MYCLAAYPVLGGSIYRPLPIMLPYIGRNGPCFAEWGFALFVAARTFSMSGYAREGRRERRTDWERYSPGATCDPCIECDLSSL